MAESVVAENRAQERGRASMAQRVGRLLRSGGLAGLDLRHVSNEKTEITIKRIFGRGIRITFMEDLMEIERPPGHVLYQVSSRRFMGCMGLSQERLPKDFSYNPWRSRGAKETRDGVKAIRTLLPNIASIVERYPKVFEIYRKSDYPWDTDFV